MGETLICTWTTIHWPTYSQQPNWVQPVIAGLSAWQTTISSCTTKPERQTLMQMPYRGCPCQDAFLKTQVCARGCRWRSCKHHQGLQLQSVHPGPSPGQSAGCLYDLRRLASGPTSRSYSKSGHSRLWYGTLEWWQSKLTDPPEFSLFLWEWNHLVLKQGILYRWARPRESEETLSQLVLPATQREVALKGCHDQVGHLGLECMPDLMCDQFFWPCMAAQAKEHIKKCCLCLAYKAKQPKAPLENIVATHPLEFVHLNYLCLEQGKGLEEIVLVVTDHFTRYTQAYVTRTQTTAKTLWDKFIVHYGLPKKILLDQGQNFKSQLVADLCTLMGMQKIWTSPYHPQTNSQCERFNSTQINMLGMLPQRKSQSGKTTLEHWSMPTIAPETQLQGSAPTISCMEDNPTFQ